MPVQVGGIRRIIVPVELGYPDSDFNKLGPKPTTFSGERASGSMRAGPRLGRGGAARCPAGLRRAAYNARECVMPPGCNALGQAGGVPHALLIRPILSLTLCPEQAGGRSTLC